MTRRILVLFPDEWDRALAEDPRWRGRYEFRFEGFDLFRFPDNARLFTFDALAFVEELAAFLGHGRAGNGLAGSMGGAHAPFSHPRRAQVFQV